MVRHRYQKLKEAGWLSTVMMTEAFATSTLEEHISTFSNAFVVLPPLNTGAWGINLFHAAWYAQGL